ncbi:MAG: aldolase/citrate lyase family protein [Coxiellaceae bacterium]|nr:aldolase/citrate lyase family protein [Coxiellaceae bacterium]
MINQLKKKLSSGHQVFGSWSMLASPAVMNVMGQSGLDFVIIDMEHGPMNFETAENQIYATESADSTPVVRLGDVDELSILRSLEIGAQALLVSHVDTAEAARRVVNAARYAPEGDRGLSPFTRRHGFSDENLPEKLALANQEMFVGVLVEGENGVNNLDEILEVDGLDMVYLGIYDISMAAGIPGELYHPKVLHTLASCAEKITKKGLIAGSVARDPKYIKVLNDAGFRFISYRCDSAMLLESFKSVNQQFQDICMLEKV